MKRNNMNTCRVGICFVALGFGIVSMCIFPAKWIVVITSVLLVVSGAILIRR